MTLKPTKQFLLKSPSIFFKDLILVAVLLLFTFPKISPDFGIGLDPSYVWGLNHLFANQYQQLIKLIYPIGPLGFLKMPTTEGYNLLLSILVFNALKIGFISLMLFLNKLIQGKKTVLSLAMMYIACLFASIDILLIGSSFILLLLNLKKPNFVLFTSAVFLAALGLFIKSSIGITSFSIIATASLLQYAQAPRSLSTILKQIGLTLLVTFMFGLIVFQGDGSLLMNYFIGIVKLSGGYSDTLSLHPPNNWLLLVPFLLLLLLSPLYIKHATYRHAYILFLFPLFATWKHAMSREDMSHYYLLINFLFAFGSIICLATFSKKKEVIGLFAICLLLVFSNMKCLPQYAEKNIAFVRIDNFLSVIDFKNFKDNYAKVSQENILPHKLTPRMLKLIGNSTIDVYPWEHSYIAANKLQWKPRTTLEIGASTSQWASTLASESYHGGSNAPVFILFHLVQDAYKGSFGSIDGRYILNDEPLVIYAILQHYTLVEKNDAFLLFQKNEQQQPLQEAVLEKTVQSQFGRWINIPNKPNEITRLKVSTNNTLLGTLKKFLYKEEKYEIDYQFEDGHMLTYRYIPATANDGLWCHPFILHPQTNTIEQKVMKVRLRNSNDLFVSKAITLKIERIHVKTNNTLQQNMANSLFLKQDVKKQDSIIVDDLFTFDYPKQKMKKQCELSTQFFYSEYQSNVIDGKGYSCSLSYSLDSICKNLPKSVDALDIMVSAQTLNALSTGKLIITSTNAKEDFWEGNPLKNTNYWSYSLVSHQIWKQKQASGNLKIYVWNTGEHPIFMDDLRVVIKTISK